MNAQQIADRLVEKQVVTRGTMPDGTVGYCIGLPFPDDPIFTADQLIHDWRTAGACLVYSYKNHGPQYDRILSSIRKVGLPSTELCRTICAAFAEIET